MQREFRPYHRPFGFLGLLLVVGLAFVPSSSHALIMGGKGNKPVDDPGWPKGANSIFNYEGRIAYWVSDGIDGWHADCRGDAKALNGILEEYAELDVKPKRVVLHSGLGNSYLINPNREGKWRKDSWCQWTFMVQEPLPQRAVRIRRRPNPAVPAPPVHLDVYTGGDLVWDDVVIPKGLKVVDKRLEAHGFELKDGIVLEGHITDLSTGQPIPGKVQLQRVEAKKEGRRYPVVTETAVDKTGHWVMKNTPVGWYRVVATAEGYAPRIVAYDRFNVEPSYHDLPGRLAPAGAVSGSVIDEKGEPLGGVTVRLADVVSIAGDRYESSEAYSATTDADGRFRIEPVPVGEAEIGGSKKGYFQPSTDKPISMPVGGIELSLAKSAEVHVIVDFTGKKRAIDYLIEIEAEDGDAEGNYGGTANIDANDEYTFKSVPPGRYIIHGHPNPTTPKQRTAPVIVELIGGKVAEVELKAK